MTKQSAYNWENRKKLKIHMLNKTRENVRKEFRDMDGRSHTHSAAAHKGQQGHSATLRVLTTDLRL